MNMSHVQKSEVVRYPLRLRRVEVARVAPVAPAMVRITVTGEDLEGFHAPGPADHIKVFFPDESGNTAVPMFTPEGPRPPATGTVLARDYTPLRFRADQLELDLDFVLHGDDGPASRWAAAVQPGTELRFAGPRGSHLPPEGVTNAIIVADETGLPAAWRWIEHFHPEVPVTGLFSVGDKGTARYLDEVPATPRHWFTGASRDAELEAALRSLDVTPGTFIFLAGEAGAVVPLRRYLRRELGLSKDQVDAHGYWKQGVTNLDHHAPLDPDDAD